MRSSFDSHNASHQNRFSAQYKHGLSAVAVSRRRYSLLEEDEFPLLWMIRQRSWQRRGLRGLAIDLLFGSFRQCVRLDRLRFVNMDPAAWMSVHLERACLDPNYSLDLSESNYWEGDFIAALHELRRHAIARAAGSLCETTASRLVFETLENALESPGSISLCLVPPGSARPVRQGNGAKCIPVLLATLKHPP